MIMRKKNKKEKKLCCAVMCAILLSSPVSAEEQSSVKGENVKSIKTIWQDPIGVTQKRLQGNYADVKNFLQEKSAAVYAEAVKKVRAESNNAIKNYVKDKLSTVIFKIGTVKDGGAVVSSEKQTWSKVLNHMGINIPGLNVIESGLSLTKIFGDIVGVPTLNVPTTDEVADSFIEECVELLSRKAEERVWSFIENKGNKKSVKTPDVDQDKKGLSRKQVKEIKADLSGRPDRESQWNDAKWSLEDVKNYLQFNIKTKINDQIDFMILKEIKSQKSKVAKEASEYALQELAKISMPGYIPRIAAKPVAGFVAKKGTSSIAQLAKYFKLDTWADEKINDNYDSFQNFLPITESELNRFYQGVIKSEEVFIDGESFQNISVEDLPVSATATGWYKKFRDTAAAAKNTLSNAADAVKSTAINALAAAKNLKKGTLKEVSEVENALTKANVGTAPNVIKKGAKTLANVVNDLVGNVSPKDNIPIDNQNYGNKDLTQGVEDMSDFKVGEVGEEEKGPFPLNEDTNAPDQNLMNASILLQ